MTVDSQHIVCGQLPVIAVQINGKIKATMDIPVDETQENVIAKAHAIEAVAAILEGKTIVKEIYVKGRILNIVVK